MNWESKSLGEVCEIEKQRHDGSLLPYIGMEHIESSTGRFLGSYDPLSVKSSTFSFRDTHLLYGRLRPYLNKVFLPSFEGHCSTEVFPIQVGSEIDRKFLFYWFTMESTINKIKETCTGARMPRANMGEVMELSISFPVVKEQK